MMNSPRTIVEEFTPGPWEAERDLGSDDLPRPWVGRLAESRYAALVCGATVQEATANAHLISAAPELLEAAQMALRGAEGVDRVLHANGLMQGIQHPAIPVLRAAIAKAQGQ